MQKFKSYIKKIKKIERRNKIRIDNGKRVRYGKRWVIIEGNTGRKASLFLFPRFFLCLSLLIIKFNIYLKFV